MTVNWTEAALADLHAIDTYLAQHSPHYGRSMVERILYPHRPVGGLPRLGVEVPEYGDESLRELLESPNRIVYCICADRVDVLAVVHGARRMPLGL